MYVNRIHVKCKNICLIIMAHNICFHLFRQNYICALTSMGYWQILFSVSSCVACNPQNYFPEFIDGKLKIREIKYYGPRSHI